MGVEIKRKEQIYKRMFGIVYFQLIVICSSKKMFVTLTYYLSSQKALQKQVIINNADVLLSLQWILQ